MTPRKPGVSHPVRQAVEATPDDLHSTELPVQDPGDQEGTEGPPHATRGLDRVAGVDFRDPVAEDVSRRSRTAPFFHQHASADLKTAIQFYDKGEFANSPGGKLVGSIGPGLGGGSLDAIIAFLQLVGVEPQAPAITGAVAQTQTGTANLSPFPSISVSDPTTPAQTLTVTIQLDAPGKVSLVSTYEPGSGGPADGASFSFPAIPGRRYIVEKSTNLLDWYTMAEVIPLTTSGQVALPPTNEPKHFYRVALSP